MLYNKETLSTIAEQYGVTPERLIIDNERQIPII